MLKPKRLGEGPTHAGIFGTERSRRLLYPLLGLVVAAAASLGLLLLRLALAPYDITLSREMAHESGVYLYTFIVMACAFGGFGLAAGRREDALRAQSISDPLTGLMNRRYFTNRLQAEIKRCTRSSTPLAVLLIDVDRLKTINDTQGHSAGDVMLRTLAKCMRQVCRSTDVLARLGGDEFAVLAPVTTARQAVELANRLRGSLKGYSTPTLPLSVSIGVSDLEQVAGQHADTLLDAADMALYSAKDSGRDQVFMNNTTRPRSWMPSSNPSPENRAQA